jgi:ParB family chromosome partitioning protein
MSDKKQKRVLGRGLDALLGNSNDNDNKLKPQSNVNSFEIDINSIYVNPNQPRSNFDSVEIDSLSDSIKDLGIIQPITVRKINQSKYEIISGERRFRASKKAGLTSIPCYIREVEIESDILKMSLVENVQRVDLDPIEIGLSYERLIDEHKLDIESISRIVGKDRSTISNYIRLLKLDPIIQSGIRDKFLTMGHGRALVNVDDKKIQLEIYELIISKNLSVRQTEKIVGGLKIKKANSNISSDVSRIYIDVTNQFEKLFGSKVRLKEDSNGKVSLSTSFKSIKLRNFFLSILILISFNSYCQSELDSIYVSPRKQRLINDPLTPSKAAFYSSVIPGLGQVYTRRYWMVPIIYGGLGTSAYYFNYNQKEMNKYRNAYKRRLAGYFDDEYIDIIPENEKLLEGMKFHRRYKDFAFMFLVGTYVLNIIDANVGAHLLQFNVSEDLSLRPFIESNYFDFSQNAGIKLKINLD